MSATEEVAIALAQATVAAVAVGLRAALAGSSFSDAVTLTIEQLSDARARAKFPNYNPNGAP